MALTIITTIAGFSSYNDTNADIIMVRDADRTSGNHFFWNTATTAQNEGTRYDGATIPFCPCWVLPLCRCRVFSPATVAWAGKQENNDARAKGKIINESRIPSGSKAIAGLT